MAMLLMLPFWLQRHLETLGLFISNLNWMQDFTEYQEAKRGSSDYKIHKQQMQAGNRHSPPSHNESCKQDAT